MMADSKHKTVDFDLYGILDLKIEDVTDEEVVQAYRKIALKYHPENNPDNPAAADMFLKISKALEILCDVPARAAYDNLRKAQRAAAERYEKINEGRKKLRQDFEAREEMARDANTASPVPRTEDEKERSAAEKLAQEIERLRTQGSELLRREKEEIARQIRERAAHASSVSSGSDAKREEHPRLKLRWKSAKDDPENGGYNSENLQGMFERYGDVVGIVISAKKKGTAVVEFSSATAAMAAKVHECGHAGNPLEISWLSGEPSWHELVERFGIGDATSVWDVGEKIVTKIAPDDAKTAEFGILFDLTNDTPHLLSIADVVAINCNLFKASPNLLNFKTLDMEFRQDKERGFSRGYAAALAIGTVEKRFRSSLLCLGLASPQAGGCDSATGTVKNILAMQAFAVQSRATLPSEIAQQLTWLAQTLLCDLAGCECKKVLLPLEIKGSVGEDTMADSEELEQIRSKRMGELQAQNQSADDQKRLSEAIAKEEEMKNAILSQAAASESINPDEAIPATAEDSEQRIAQFSLTLLPNDFFNLCSEFACCRPSRHYATRSSSESSSEAVDESEKNTGVCEDSDDAVEPSADAEQAEAVEEFKDAKEDDGKKDVVTEQ